MQNLTLDGSAKTPTVSFDALSGVLEIKGRCIPENSIEFYKPLNDWLDNYGSAPKSATSVDVKLEYFNTSSSKCILDFFKKLEGLNGKNTDVQVNWYFEQDDEDMEEAGQDYKAILSIPFNIIEVEEIN